MVKKNEIKTTYYMMHEDIQEMVDLVFSERTFGKKCFAGHIVHYLNKVKKCKIPHNYQYIEIEYLISHYQKNDVHEVMKIVITVRKRLGKIKP